MISLTPRKALALAAVTVVLVWLPAVQAAARGLAITNQDNGRSFRVSAGQKIILNLRDPKDGGYDFLPPQYDQSILEMLGERHVPRTEPPRMGDFGRKVYEFKALKLGKTDLVIPIKRPWEKQSETYLKVTISVQP
jgi:predicted secreted protein